MWGRLRRGGLGAHRLMSLSTPSFMLFFSIRSGLTTIAPSLPRVGCDDRESLTTNAIWLHALQSGGAAEILVEGEVSHVQVGGGRAPPPRFRREG